MTEQGAVELQKGQWATVTTKVAPNSLVISGYKLEDIIANSTLLETAHLIVGTELPSEEVLQDHPAIQDVGVAGVPDPKRGETVKAWLVLNEGYTLTREELKEWCLDKMAKYKIPTEIEIRDELPKTHVGKLLRRELVRDHAEKSAG